MEKPFLSYCINNLDTNKEKFLCTYMLVVIYVFLKSISNLFEVNICCIVFGQFRVCVKSILPIGLISLVKAKVTLFDV